MTRTPASRLTARHVAPGCTTCDSPSREVGPRHADQLGRLLRAEHGVRGPHCYCSATGAANRRTAWATAGSPHVRSSVGCELSATEERPEGRHGYRLEAELGLHVAHTGAIVNHMVQYKARLDSSFTALSDATRRGVLEQLVRADASITDLADKFHMTLTGMKKHVGVLERAGLVSTEKVGRVRTCKLGRRRLEEEVMWIEKYRQLWDARFDELDKVVEELKRQEKTDGRRKR